MQLIRVELVWEGKTYSAIIEPPDKVVLGGIVVGTFSGKGGEGIVYKMQFPGTAPFAMKIIDNLVDNPGANASKENVEKLQKLITISSSLPSNLLYPKNLVKTQYGGIIGFTMEWVENLNLFHELCDPDSTVKLSQILRIFLDAGDTLQKVFDINCGIGDLNSKGIGYTNRWTTLWLDVDSISIPGFPCKVGTADYLHPDLKGTNLGVTWRKEHDIYSLILLLFEVIFKVKPYLGTYKLTLSERIRLGVWLFALGVGRPPHTRDKLLITDELFNVLKVFLADKQLGIWPRAEIQACLDSLIQCRNCNEEYTSQRPACPLCGISNGSTQSVPNPIPVKPVFTPSSIPSTNSLVFGSPPSEIIEHVRADINTYVLTKGQGGIYSLYDVRHKTRLRFGDDSYVLRLDSEYLVIGEKNRLRLASIRYSNSLSQIILKQRYDGLTEVIDSQPVYALGRNKLYTVRQNMLFEYDFMAHIESALFPVADSTSIYASEYTGGVILVNQVNGGLNFKLYAAGNVNVLRILDNTLKVNTYRVFFDNSTILITVVIGDSIKFVKLNLAANTVELKTLDLKTEAKWFDGDLSKYTYLDGNIYVPEAKGILKVDVSTGDQTLSSTLEVRKADKLLSANRQILSYNSRSLRRFNIF